MNKTTLAQFETMTDEELMNVVGGGSVYGYVFGILVNFVLTPWFI